MSFQLNKFILKGQKLNSFVVNNKFTVTNNRFSVVNNSFAAVNNSFAAVNNSFAVVREFLSCRNSLF